MIGTPSSQLGSQLGARFVGQVVWVTGAGAGIGRATAIRLAREGAVVAVSTLDSAQAEETLSACRAAAPDQAVRHGATVTDLSDPEEIVAAHAELAATLGPIDVLVNNVGINQPRLMAVDTTDDVFSRIMGVNFLSAVRCTRLVLPTMITR